MSTKPTTPQYAPPPPKKLTRYQRDIVAAPWYLAPDGSPIYDMSGVLPPGIGEKPAAKPNVMAAQKARQIGYSEAAAIRIICFCLGRQVMPNGDCIAAKPLSGIIVSKDFAGARLVLSKVAANLREMAGAGDDEARLARVDATKIVFPTRGTEVRALAGQGSTIRGWTGFFVLDEFAFVRNQEEVWGASTPVARPNLGSPFGSPGLLITTPWASGTLAHRLFTDPSTGLSQSSVNIYEAVAQGFPINIEETFAQLAIPELIETEYKCVWGKGGNAFFPLEKVLACVRDDGIQKLNGTALDGTPRFETIDHIGLPSGWDRAPCFYGIDVGMGVGRDFTACVQVRIIDDEYWVTGVRAFNHLDDPTAQIDMLAPWIRQSPGEVRIDHGGGGRMLEGALRTRMAGSRIEISCVTLDRKMQEQLALKLRRLIDVGQLRIYAGCEQGDSGRTATGGDVEGHRALCLELSQLKAKMAGSGVLQLETPRDEYRGHCDRAWGLMIALSSRQGASILVPHGAGLVTAPPPRIINFEDVGIIG